VLNTRTWSRVEWCVYCCKVGSKACTCFNVVKFPASLVSFAAVTFFPMYGLNEYQNTLLSFIFNVFSSNVFSSNNTHLRLLFERITLYVRAYWCCWRVFLCIFCLLLEEYAAFLVVCRLFSALLALASSAAFFPLLMLLQGLYFILLVFCWGAVKDASSSLKLESLLQITIFLGAQGD
jgi:hypothetical protein